MNRVTLIQLRGNIPYTLFRIGGIGSKYNPTNVSISTKLEREHPSIRLSALKHYNLEAKFRKNLKERANTR